MAEVRRSVCALDCPDCCSLLVTVENGRGVKLRGNPDHPVTRGFLCGKVAQYLEREYSPERLLYPRRRVGAKGEGLFERISWDEALDTVANRLKAIARDFGPEAILPYSYAGTMGLLNREGMDRRLWQLPDTRQVRSEGITRRCPESSSGLKLDPGVFLR